MPGKSSKTVLLVDDDSINHKTLGRLLNKRGYQVVHANSGPAAVKIVMSKKRTFSFIVMDCSMPILDKSVDMAAIDGVTAAKIIKARQPNVKIILWTTNHQNEIPNHANDLFFARLAKPYEPAQVKQLLNQIENIPNEEKLDGKKTSLPPISTFLQVKSLAPTERPPPTKKSTGSSIFSKNKMFVTDFTIPSPAASKASSSSSLNIRVEEDEKSKNNLVTLPVVVPIRASPTNTSTSPLPARSLSSSPATTPRPNTWEKQRLIFDFRLPALLPVPPTLPEPVKRPVLVN